jgi:tetratricopeptide (TPR) repeat protein
MRITIALLIAVLICGCQHQARPVSKSNQAPVRLLEGMGNVHHPVSTSNPEAQRYFDQGLALIYAFNHDAAVRSFRKAQQLDPNLATAYWGEALAIGPNYNLPEIDREAIKQAVTAVQRAQQLAAGATPAEQAYISAVSKRYSEDPKADLQQLARDYKNAMGDVARRYPDDLDAATLYAESAMNLRPWKLWTSDGKSEEGTEEIVAVLEGVLKRNPQHTGEPLLHPCGGGIAGAAAGADLRGSSW